MTEPNKTSPDSPPDTVATNRPRWKREVIVASACLGFGFLLIPALIYLVGVPLLGTYGGGPHIGSFYGDFYRNLLSGSGRTWYIVLGPLLLLSVLRLIFWPWRAKVPANQPGQSTDVAQAQGRKERREPFVAP